MIHYTTSRRIFTSPQVTEIGPFSFRFFLKSLCGNADFNPARYFGMDRSNGKTVYFFCFSIRSRSLFKMGARYWPV